MKQARTIQDVAERQLCLGCGVCAYLEPDAYRMVDDLTAGRRPLPIRAAAAEQGDALRACPGISLDHGEDPEGVIAELRPDWGPVLAVYEGYAADSEVRFRGSSGGAASALALYALEREGMAGLLHIAARPDVPYLNHTVLSTSRAEVLAATGSRYAPASPCDRLDLVERADAPCVFIGKPCDVAGARRAAAQRPELERNLGLTIGIFCAGTPSLAGTLELAATVGVPEPAAIRSIRYRGNGWPGRATVTWADAAGAEREASLSYEDSWGEILQRRRPWRCHVCPDHTGEFADVAVGDPWYREILPGEPGRSLIIARTARGHRIVERAIADGALVAEQVPGWVLAASQPNLMRARGAIWGRLLTTRVTGVPTPRFTGFPCFHAWRRHLGVRDKLGSILGTARRIRRRRLHGRRAVQEYRPRLPRS